MSHRLPSPLDRAREKAAKGLEGGRSIGTNRRKDLHLKVPPPETPISNFLTSSGTFRDGDLVLNENGLHIMSQNSVAPTPSTDDTFTMEDFEAVRVIGKGSGGMVQLVRHKWTGQLFALKVIQMNIEDNVRKQIVQELKINQASQCLNVVVCYHAFYTNGVISIVLEYMDRGSLADVIRDFRKIPEPYLGVICKQVLEGLTYLHDARHVIHRDIKPSNLLVNHKGEVKITDFGVSATVTNSMAQQETFVGTYNYMSPERISGSAHSYDSDIWSLGLVILECATGRFPYLPPGQEQGWVNFYELLETIVSQQPPTLPADQFSAELRSFVSKCVQKDPRQRLSARQLLEHPFVKKYDGKNINLGEFLQGWSPLF